MTPALTVSAEAGVKKGSPHPAPVAASPSRRRDGGGVPVPDSDAERLFDSEARQVPAEVQCSVLAVVRVPTLYAIATCVLTRVEVARPDT
jgi:hypothetical protein